MTLAEYLNARQEEAENILVSVGDELPHPEHHPLSPEELPFYVKLWSDQWTREQQARNAIAKRRRRRPDPRPSTRLMQNRILRTS